MTTDAVRSIIREILAEELSLIAKERKASALVSKPSVDEEFVSINNDDDLQSLVQHILKLSLNRPMRDKIARGDHVFRLKITSDRTSGRKANMAVPASQGGVVQIENGFLSERQVEALPQETKIVRLGRAVRFTPLARDRLRLRKIIIERMR